MERVAGGYTAGVVKPLIVAPMSQSEEGCPHAAGPSPSAPAPELQRVTTRFDPAQDRICLSGELVGGRVGWPAGHVADPLPSDLLGAWMDRLVSGLPGDVPGTWSDAVPGGLPGQHVVLWLTQRLLRRLVPALLDGLAARSLAEGEAEVSDALHHDAVQAFAQQAARAQWEQMPATSPVTAGADSPEHLVLSVQVAYVAHSVRLVFVGPQSPVAQMALNPQALRQWLHILWNAWRQADWPADLWPDWMHQDEASQVHAASALLH